MFVVEQNGSNMRGHHRKQGHRRAVWQCPFGAVLVLLLLLSASPVHAVALLLKDGRVLEGPFAEVGGVAESALNPKGNAGEVAVTPLVVVDDGLRRTFVHHSQIQQVLEDASDKTVRIRVWQDVAEQGGGVGRIGRALRVTPFDQFGRRIYEMAGRDGLLSVVQGITEITPVYTKVEGLAGPTKAIVWDMRIATSSIPRETLERILTAAVPQNNPDARLQVVRLYLQAERYRDAEQELEQVIHDFPDMKNLADEVGQLRQLGARLILKELQLRAKVGQPQLARAMLQKFPTEGVSGTTLEQVRELLTKFDADDHRRRDLLAKLNAQVALVADVNGRKLAENFAQEIANEANVDALGRLASFERLADASEVTAEQKVALAISGWLVGVNNATDNLHTAVSLATVRDMVRQYLRQPTAAARMQMASEIGDREGVTIERIAQLLKLMKPPLDVPDDAKRGPGLYELSTPGLSGQSDTRYLVQLPPEYDPLRQYPTIVTLGDAGVPAEGELGLVVGEKREEGEPFGQASRHGYIVISVEWQEPKQTGYGYTAREHHAALGSLREACRRFSIDTDRVFLVGHGCGGDAAWDIALAHPDMWAGVIPIVASADRYVLRYGANAQYVPWYVVAGELDGDKMAANARELDRYMSYKSECTVVEYQGRGYEPFGDEIQRIFDWMGRKSRKIPKEFEVVTMRPWDNFFWWLDVEDLAEKSMVSPATWPPPRAARPLRLESKLMPGNKITVKGQAGSTTVWLGPEFIKFDEPIVIELNGRKMTPNNREIRPDLSVLLEDARTRADRQHPFWAKVETGGETRAAAR